MTNLAIALHDDKCVLRVLRTFPHDVLGTVQDDAEEAAARGHARRQHRQAEPSRGGRTRYTRTCRTRVDTGQHTSKQTRPPALADADPALVARGELQRVEDRGIRRLDSALRTPLPPPKGRGASFSAPASSPARPVRVGEANGDRAVVYLAKRRYDQRRDLLDRSALEKRTIHGLDHETRLDDRTRLRGPTLPHPPHDALARLFVDVDVQTQRVARILRDELARRDLEPEVERALRGRVNGEVPEQKLDLVVPVWVCEQNK